MKEKEFGKMFRNLMEICYQNFNDGNHDLLNRILAILEADHKKAENEKKEESFL